MHHNLHGLFEPYRPIGGPTVYLYSLYRGCINKSLHLSTFTAFYGISSSIARINIISLENMRMPDDAERGNMMPIDRAVRTDVRTTPKGGTHDDESSLH